MPDVRATVADLDPAALNRLAEYSRLAARMRSSRRCDGRFSAQPSSARTPVCSRRAAARGLTRMLTRWPGAGTVVGVGVAASLRSTEPAPWLAEFDNVTFE